MKRFHLPPKIFRPASVGAILVTLIAQVPSVFGAESPTLSLSLDEALQRLRTRSPEVVLALQREHEAQASRVGAGVVLPANPRLYAELRPAITGASPWQAGFAANLEVPFELSGAAGARIKEAGQRTELAQSETALAKVVAHFSIWQSYVSAQVGAARIRVLEDAVAVLGQTKEAAAARAKAGASGDIDVAAAEADLAEFRALVEDASVFREHVVLELAHSLDIDPTVTLVLTTPIDELLPSSLPSLKATRAPQQRAELVVLRRQVNLLERMDERLRREGLPRIAIVGGVDAAPVSPIFGQLGLAVELPIAQRQQGPRAIVKAQLETERARIALKERAIAREFNVRMRSFERQLAMIALLDGQAIPAAKRHLELIAAGWKLGRFDVFRLTTAARQLHVLQLSRVDAIEKTWRERIALARAVGDLE